MIVAARGFAEQFSNKLLVLIDGRSVYTTQFSGVNWDEQDTPLEDIERIEVIRGPGATMWGANAVNGVINIITKPARDTQGLLLSVGTGSEESGSADVRYGFSAGPKLHARVFGKYSAGENSSMLPASAPKMTGASAGAASAWIGNQTCATS